MAKKAKKAAAKPRGKRQSVPLSEFGARLAPLLQAANKTPQKLAEDLGIHATTVWRWMRQSSGPRSSDIETMAIHLGVSTDRLLGKQKAAKKRAVASA